VNDDDERAGDGSAVVEGAGVRTIPSMEQSVSASEEDGVHVRLFAGHVHHAERLSRPLRVAHLTDQHFGRMTPHAAQAAAARLANQARPDLVLLTGDFVAHSLQYLDALEEVVASLQAPAFAVLGNHDYWSGADDVRWALLRAGAEILDNASTQITIRRERVQLVGVDDAYTGHHDLEKATKGLDPRLPTVGLSHIPEMADEMWARGVPLVFAGHTHAGQITVARLHELSVGRLGGHKYVHGLYGCRRGEQAEGAVYVGAGVGAAVMPLRFGERGRREVAVFELGARPGDFVEHHTEQPAFKGRKPGELKKKLRKRTVIRRAKRRAKRDAKANPDVETIEP
jgi:predicted MPP superfamily phosphohydrolase